MNLKHLRWGAGALLAGIALLVACDGENLFDPSQNPFAEPRVSLSAPSSAFAGDSMSIAISATAASNVSTITVAVRGAAVKDTTLTILTPTRSVNTSLKIGLPSVLTDTLLYVAAIATDGNGVVSKPKADTVSVVGPPSVISVTTPDSLKVGTTATIKVRAFGSRRITQLDLAIRGAITRDTTILISPALNDVTQNVSITLPAAVADTAVRLGIVVKDVTGLSSAPYTATLPLAISPPGAVLVSPVPAAVTPGGTLDLSIHGTAMRGVSKLGVVLTGALSKDTSFDVVPPQADVTLPISIRIPGDITGTSIGVAAYAIDKGGARSVPSTPVAIAVNTGIPTITSVTAPDSVRAGQIVDVRVVAQGVRPLTDLTVRFRGATNSDQHVVITPAANSVTKDVQIQLPVDVSDTLLTITAVATDQAGQLSGLTASATKIVKVTDVTAPTVTATPNVGSTSAGSTVQIRIQARDNVALKQVGYAVVNPAGDTIGTTPTLATTAGAVKDTTFSFLVPSTLTPRTVRVLGIAVDASGRRGLSTASTLTVADSAAPTITVIAPAANATLPLNDSVRVQLHIVDPTGIKTVTLKGQSTRVDSLGPTTTVQRFATKTITFNSPLPKDTIVTRYLNAIPDSISEPVTLIFTASDSLNNTASTSSSILVGGPRVELRNPLPNAQVTPGGTLVLSAFAVDRSSGIDSVQISITGAQTQNYLFKACAAAVCAPNGLPSTDSVLINQNYVVGATLGTMNIGVTAWNRNRIAGQIAPIPVIVTTTAVADTAKPQVRVSITANDRVELTDTITLNIAAQDVGTNGIRRIGAVIVAQPGGAGAPTLTLYRDTLYSGTGRTGLQPHLIKFTLKDMGYNEVNLVKLPRALTFQVHAFALDAPAVGIGNCGANVTNTLAALQCDSVNVAPAPTVSGQTWWYTAKNTPALTQLVTVVPGFARPLPTAGSTIADIIVDNNAARPRMYLSNQSLNRLEVLNLQDSTFAKAVSVGSEPWGMFINNAGNRLIVGNSGGTNISMVDITQPVNAIAEVPSERILTPNAVLFDVLTATDNAFIRYTATAHDFSDRPQFVAQDQNGIILHSTKPTGAAPDGTVRYLVPTPVGSPRPFESKILFNRNAIGANSDMTAIANVDSIVVQRNAASSDLIDIFDHPMGHPEIVISSGFLELRAAITAVRGAGSDIQDFGGQWLLNVVGLSDTTFVTTSGDRRYVGFGEGGTGPYARVWLWDATTNGISDDISVQDLVGNAAERVLGIALNADGKIGAARGASAAYFYSNDATFEGTLRLQGIFANGVSGGNGGIALHPSHNTALNSNSTTLAFVATVNRSIKIVDTFNFIERGEIQIRDNIVGPLRAALPLAAENVGVPPDPITGTADCNVIWTKLYGVTGAGRAVIINVRKKDVTNPTITAGPCSP